LKRFSLLILAVMLLSVRAQAQQVPAWEVSAGYSSFTANLIHPRLHLNGGNASLNRNVNSWFGLRVDVGAYAARNDSSWISQVQMETAQGNNAGFKGSPTSGSPSLETFSGGPVISLRRYKWCTPFALVELGAAHGGAAYLGFPEHVTSFASTAGGGADLRMNELVGIRLEAVYINTVFNNPPASFSRGSTEGNLRLSAGLVFHFGSK
jgi:hypothetical protein